MRFLTSIFVFIFLFSCHQTRYIDHIDMKVQPINNQIIGSNAALDSFIKPYQKVYRQKMFDTLAYNPAELSVGRREGSLGDWVLDGMKWYCDSVLDFHTDFAISNSGGIRVKSLAQGPVLLKNIYEIMPFDNAMVILELDTTAIDSMTDFARRGWPVSSEYSIFVDSNTHKAIWQIQKKSKGPKFRLVISNFLANGGDKMSFMTAFEQTQTNINIRDALIAYAKHQKILRVSREHRTTKKTSHANQ
jgi:2',3'-cyclic-nucleotide 2'-phosphodiesterase (5'-nucleotidase family)